MHRYKYISTVLLLAVLLFVTSCLREWQTESMLSPTNSRAFTEELKHAAKKASLPPGKRVGITSALKEGNTFSPKTVSVQRAVGSYYSFASDELSEHQKIMIDDFLKEAINKDESMVRVTDEREADLLTIAYIRSYTWHRYLHFDIFDKRANALVGNIKYELSKMTTGVEQKK